MERNREHLALPVIGEPLPRRKKQGFGGAKRKNRKTHGENLQQQTDTAVEQLKSTEGAYPEGFHPASIVKVSLNPKGTLDETVLARMGLRLLGDKDKKALVVSTDDAGIEEVKRRLSEYADPDNETVRGEIDNIDGIAVFTREDRMGRRLEMDPLDAEEAAAVDIELWHTGNLDEIEKHIRKIETKLEEGGYRISDRYLGGDLVLLRVRITREILDSLLEYSEIKEIDRPPKPAFERSEILQGKLDDFDFEELADDVVGIVVMDSGVLGSHPFLEKALGDAQVFPDRLKQKITTGEEDRHGHGTAVSGIAVYGDVKEHFDRRQFTPHARIFSAKVTDDQNLYDEDELLEHQLQEAVEYYLSNYDNVRVFNISLGDPLAFFNDSRQTRFAAAVDDLAYRFRDREILFVISSGNFKDLDPEEFVDQYPEYLLENPRARLIDPATSALALSVGGLSFGKVGERYDETDVKRMVAGEPGFPSPFTRSGPGVNGAIKPELVETAGDWEFNKLSRGFTEAGVLSANNNFATSGRLFNLWMGTSFAAPKVACMAARLMRIYPDYSSNLIRALLVHSASVPNHRPSPLDGLPADSEPITRIYGYGQPSLERAIMAGSNDAWMLFEDSMELDTFKILEIPEIPDDFFEKQGRRGMKVTLAFDPPTRHTRMEYLGVKMGFYLFRNSDPDDIRNIFRTWDTTEGDPPGMSEFAARQKVNLSPSWNVRTAGTVQNAWIEITDRGAGRWSYQRGEPLHLVLTCQRKWAPADIDNQRVAVILSVFHEDENAEIQGVLQARLQSFARARAQV